MEPLTLRPALFIANNTSIKPNHITLLSLILNVSSAFFFIYGTPLSLFLGALVFESSFLLDYVDGTLARLTHSASSLGRKLDFLGGCLYINVVLLSVLISQGLLKGDILLFAVGLIYILFNDLFHFNILPSGELITSNAGTEISGAQKSGLLSSIFYKWGRLKVFFGRFRLTAFPTEIDTLNIILFLAPILGFLFWGTLFGLLAISVQLLTFVIIKKS